ncbi:MAG: hypothetical protein WCH05_05560 [Chlorobiaceae bacterium]
MSILGSTMEIAVTVAASGNTIDDVLISIIDPDGTEVVTGQQASLDSGIWYYYWQSPAGGIGGNYICTATARSGVNAGIKQQKIAMLPA